MDGVLPALGQARDVNDIGATPKESRSEFESSLNLPSNESVKGITGGAYHSLDVLNRGEF